MVRQSIWMLLCTQSYRNIQSDKMMPFRKKYKITFDINNNKSLVEIYKDFVQTHNYYTRLQRK